MRFRPGCRPASWNRVRHVPAQRLKTQFKFLRFRTKLAASHCPTMTGCQNAAILVATMTHSLDPQTPDSRRQRAWVSSADWVKATQPKLTKAEQQQLAHERNRICKDRSCVACTPLRERRRLKKAQRKAEAQTRAHEQEQPCGRANCSIVICVTERNAVSPKPPPVKPDSNHRATNEINDDPEQIRRRESKRHRVGLPCGSEVCANQVCIEGFINERTRRHRARRPCRSSTCDNPICVSTRSKT